MPLTMRPTGLSSPIDQHREDYTIFSGEWAVGRIYEERGGPQAMRWFWSLYGWLAEDADMRTDGRAPTLDEAKAQLEAAWRQWLAWAKLTEMP
jgi:hypothetical protein